jgi:hypothetical protein
VDRVLDDRALAVDLLEPRNPPTALIGDEDSEAVPVVVAKRELRAGMESFAAAGRTRPGGPGREVEVRKLRDLSAVTRLAVGA